MRSRAVGMFAAVISAFTAVIVAQTPSPQRLAFDVASIKRNVSGQQNRGIGLAPGGGFSATNLPVRALIRFAYPIQNYQLIGAPDWVNTEFYDVAAKAPASVVNSNGRVMDEEVQEMLQALLAERFRLAVHHESRELPTYVIMLAHNDGTLGPSIRKSEVDCDALEKSGAAPPRPVPGQPPLCGGRFGAGRIMMNGFPLSQLALNLSTWTERFVVDRTGLDGAFNYDLQWVVDQMPMFDQIGAPSRALATSPDPAGPSLFTAMQEQLGLRLEPSRGPVDILVIDHIEKPTED